MINDSTLPVHPTETIAAAPERSPEPSASDALANGWQRYTNEVYGFSFTYSPDWKIVENSPNFLRLRNQKSDIALTVGFRFITEDVRIMRTGVGGGDVMNQGMVSFLGDEISRDVLVYEGKVKAVLYNMATEIQAGDLIFTLSLDDFSQDYESVDVPPDLQDEIDKVVESFDLLD